MTWQEYQEAVSQFYEQLEGLGTVRKNITLPDKVTGQPRQIDTWVELEGKGHKLGILIDAKFRKEKVDVKDVEEVLALANAVGANMSVLVALSGWTEPAEVKAKFAGLDLKLFTLEEALEQIVPDNWMMCPACSEECITAVSGGIIVDGMWSLLVAGQCRGCKSALVWCWACGDNVLVDPQSDYACGCGHTWRNSAEDVSIRRRGTTQWSALTDGYGSIEEFFIDIPEPEQPQVEDAGFYIRRGIIFRDQGRVDEAVRNFNQAITLDPASAFGYYHRAQAFDMADHSEQAIQDYDKAIELDSRLAMAFGSRGAIYYSQERYREAVADFKQFLKLMPDSPNKQAIHAAIIHCEMAIAEQQD